MKRGNVHGDIKADANAKDYRIFFSSVLCCVTKLRSGCLFQTHFDLLVRVAHFICSAHKSLWKTQLLSLPLPPKQFAATGGKSRWARREISAFDHISCYRNLQCLQIPARLYLVSQDSVIFSTPAREFLLFCSGERDTGTCVISSVYPAEGSKNIPLCSEKVIVVLFPPQDSKCFVPMSHSGVEGFLTQP